MEYETSILKIVLEAVASLGFVGIWRRALMISMLGLLGHGLLMRAARSEDQTSDQTSTPASAPASEPHALDWSDWPVGALDQLLRVLLGFCLPDQLEANFLKLVNIGSSDDERQGVRFVSVIGHHSDIRFWLGTNPYGDELINRTRKQALLNQVVEALIWSPDDKLNEEGIRAIAATLRKNVAPLGPLRSAEIVATLIHASEVARKLSGGSLKPSDTELSLAQISLVVGGTEGLPRRNPEPCGLF